MPLDLPDIVPEADEAFGADQPPPATLAVSSPAFAHETLLPAVYTCDGAGISPPLTWDSVPEGTETFALICDTPNAPEGILAHWVVYNLPAAARGMPPGIVFAPDSPDNGTAGINDFGQTGYSAPCPPPGGAPYHYYFKLYALRTRLGLTPGATKRELVRAMQGHILATGQMMVVCRR
ncbi:MAG: YbhB/YbcL family Raf kinase inhibitor-like protein [Anaerolineae bacterium]|nr:YbhB/YbcL family Raf kinase inhibitor-like protein [Anaerolineae bacterium]